MPINFDYAAFFLCIEANSHLFGPHIFLRALKRSQFLETVNRAPKG